MSSDKVAVLRPQFQSAVDAPQPQDPTTRAQAWLTSRGVYFQECSASHLKVEDVNYYPHRGTIYCDGAPSKERERGLDGLEVVLRRKGLMK